MGSSVSYDVTGVVFVNNPTIYANIILQIVGYGTFANQPNTCDRTAYNPIPKALRGFSDSTILTNQTVNDFTDYIFGKVSKQEESLNMFQENVQKVHEDYVGFVRETEKLSRSAYQDVQSAYKNAPKMYDCYLIFSPIAINIFNTAYANVRACYNVLKFAVAMNSLKSSINSQCTKLTTLFNTIAVAINKCNTNNANVDAKRDCLVNLMNNKTIADSIFNEVAKLLDNFTQTSTLSTCVQGVTADMTSSFNGNLTDFNTCINQA